MVLIAATKIQVLNPLERFGVQIFLRLLRTLHADVFLFLMSFSVLSILEPRYVKSLISFWGLPLLPMSGPWLFTLNAKKTEYMALTFNVNSRVPLMASNGDPLKQAKDFKYLGWRMEGTESDIKERETSAWTALNNLKVWTSNLQRSLITQIFVAAIKTILL